MISCIIFATLDLADKLAIIQVDQQEVNYLTS